nr:hypothetical protein BaRGS_026769 [Batillaria attramentaria]
MPGEGSPVNQYEVTLIGYTSDGAESGFRNYYIVTNTTPASEKPQLGLACGAGCWLPEGVSNPAPLPPQDLLGQWFLSRSLP